MKIDMLNSENINLHENVDKNNLIMSKNEQEKIVVYDQTSKLLSYIENNSKEIKKHNYEVTKLEEKINGILKNYSAVVWVDARKPNICV